MSLIVAGRESRKIQVTVELEGSCAGLVGHACLSSENRPSSCSPIHGKGDQPCTPQCPACDRERKEVARRQRLAAAARVGKH